MKKLTIAVLTLTVSLAASTAKAIDTSVYSSRAALLGHTQHAARPFTAASAIDPSTYNSKLAMLGRAAPASAITVAVLAAGRSGTEVTLPARQAISAASFNTKRALIGR